MTRILFICMGNICRSPAAEIVFRKMAADAGRGGEFEIDSAGTIGFHNGKPLDPRMAVELAGRGYTVDGRSRQLQPEDLRNFDMLLTMDEENLADTLAMDGFGVFHHKVKPFIRYLNRLSAPRIPDPYYGGDCGFAHAVDLLEDGCASLLEATTDSPG